VSIPQGARESGIKGLPMPLQIPTATEESPHLVCVDTTGQWTASTGAKSEKEEYGGARSHVGHPIGGLLALVRRQPVKASQVEDEGVVVPDVEIAQMGDVSAH